MRWVGQEGGGGGCAGVARAVDGGRAGTAYANNSNEGQDGGVVGGLRVGLITFPAESKI